MPGYNRVQYNFGQKSFFSCMPFEISVLEEKVVFPEA